MIVSVEEIQANEVHDDLMTIYQDLQEIAVHESVSHKAKCRAVSGLCRVTKALNRMGLMHTAKRPPVFSGRSVHGS